MGLTDQHIGTKAIREESNRESQRSVKFTIGIQMILPNFFCWNEETLLIIV